MRPGQQAMLYFSPIPDDKLPKHLASGDVLAGTYSLSADEQAKKAVQYLALYNINEFGGKRIGKALSTVEIEKSKEKKTPEEEYKGKVSVSQFVCVLICIFISFILESIRDHKIKSLTTIKDASLAKQIFDDLVADWGEHLPLLLAELQRLIAQKDRNLAEIKALSNRIVELAKPDEVLQFFGSKIEEIEEDLKKKSDITERKKTILKALEIKADALLDAYLASTKIKIPEAFRKQLHANPVDPKKATTPEPEAENKDKESEAPAEDAEAENKDDKEQVEETGSEGPVDSNEPVPALSDPPIQPQEVPSEPIPNVEPATLAEACAAFQEFMRFAAPDDQAVLLLTAKKAVAHEQYGIAIRCVNKLLAEPKSSSQDLHKAVYELADTLGWDHVANQSRNEYIIKYCIADRPF